MGGRITRTIYKNQRTNHRLNSRESSNQIRSITNIFSLTISTVASFLIGYLLRSHLIIGQIQDINKQQQQQQVSDDSKQWILILSVIIVMQLCYVMRIYTTNNTNNNNTNNNNSNKTGLSIIKKRNKLLVSSCIVCFIIDVVSYFIQSNKLIDILLLIGYGLLWISLSNHCMMIINNVKLFNSSNNSKKQHDCRNNSKHSITTPIEQQKQAQHIHMRRAIFCYIYGGLLYAGILCSQYMKQMRVDKSARTILQKLNHQQSQTITTIGSSITTIGSSITTTSQSIIQNNLYKLPLSYQQIVLQQQNSQRLMLRVIFSFIIFMIISTVIAFQNKSLIHMFIYDRNSKELNQYYRDKLLPLVKQINQEYTRRQPINTNSNINTNNNINNNDYRVSNNLSIRSIILATCAYIIGCVTIQHYRQSILVQNSKQSSITVGLKSYSLMLIVVIIVSYLILKLIIYSIYHYINSKKHNNIIFLYTKQILWHKKRNTLITIILMSIVFNLIMKVLYNIFNYNNQVINNNAIIKLGGIDCMYIVLSYLYIRLSRDELIRFPQTSHQYFTLISVSAMYMIRYIIPYSGLKPISYNIINYTVRTLIKVITGYQEIESNTIYVQLIVFIVLILLIIIIDQRHFTHLLATKPLHNNPNNNNQPQSQTTLIKQQQQANPIIINQINPSLKQRQYKNKKSNQYRHQQQVHDQASTFLNTQ